MICASVMPAPSLRRMSSTVRRVPLTTGFPTMISGSISMRSCFMKQILAQPTRRWNGALSRPAQLFGDHGAFAVAVDGGVGKMDAHRRALAQRRRQHRIAAVHLREGLDQRQPEAGAFLGANVCAVDLLERLAETIEIPGRDADAAVGDDDLDAARVARGADAHVAAARGELDAVGDEIDHDLLNATH